MNPRIENLYEIVDVLGGKKATVAEVVKVWMDDHIKEQKYGYQQSYFKELRKCIESEGCSNSTKIIMQLIGLKAPNNAINVTHRELADSLGIHVNTVSRVMKTLREKDFIRKVRNGYYILDPDIMVRGGSVRFFAEDLWKDAGGEP